MHSLGNGRLTLASQHTRTKLFLCPSPRSFFLRLFNEVEVLGVFRGEFSGEFVVLRTVPFSGFGGVDDAFGRGGSHTSCGIGITCHEGEEADEDRGDLPGWVPFLGMEIGKGKAKTGIRLESPRWSDHSDSRRFKGVFWRELESAHVLSAVIRGVGRALYEIVP